MQPDPEKQPTTFGAIIERRQPSPEPAPRLNRLSASKDKTATTSLPISARASPELSTPTSIRPHLHLAAATQIIDPPLPSPYSISEEQDPHVDLEAGLHPPAAKVAAPPPPTKSPTPASPSAAGPQRLSVPDTIAAASTVVGGGATPGRQVSTRSTTSTASQTSSAARTAVAVAEKSAADSRAQECTMWPSTNELRDRAAREKLTRSRNPLLRLSKRNRIIISVVIALAIIGAAIGIGVGISRAYHGEVWAGNGKSMPIPGR